MKSFIRLKNTNTQINSDSKVDYFPSFPGIFCDLDTQIESDDCDVFLGTTGLGSEFYLKDHSISKIFVELLPYNLIDFYRESHYLQFPERSNKIESHNVDSFDQISSIFPTKILIEKKINRATIFFCSFESETTAQELINSMSFFKATDFLEFGINKQNGQLCSLVISNFLQNIFYNEIQLSKKILGNERHDSLIDLCFDFFDTQEASIKFANKVDIHNSKFEKTHITSAISEIEKKVLIGLVNQKKWLKSLYGD